MICNGLIDYYNQNHIAVTIFVINSSSPRRNKSIAKPTCSHSTPSRMSIVQNQNIRAGTFADALAQKPGKSIDQVDHT